MRQNDPIILGCYKNVMLPNVKYSIKTSNIDTFEEAMEKSFEMGDNMIQSNANPNIILGRVQMLSLTNYHQVTFHDLEPSGMGRGIFIGNPPNVWNMPTETSN